MNRSNPFSRLSWKTAATLVAVLSGCGAGGPGSEDPSSSETQALSTPVAIASPPTYLGTLDDSGGCARTYHTIGFTPGSSGSHPLFLYFVGTEVTWDGGASHPAYAGAAPLDVTLAMAQRGFVALSVEYDDGLGALTSDHVAQLRCLFDQAKVPAGLLGKVCNPSNGLGINCDLGIATWGHSQGGGVALNAHTVEPRVRAAWATGDNGTQGTTLSAHKIRIVNGSADAFPPNQGWGWGANNDTWLLSSSLGLKPTDCPWQSDQCLRADGSGWILATSSELSPVRPPDHCWFDSLSCIDPIVRVEPNFAAGTSRISIASNADWLAAAASTP